MRVLFVDVSTGQLNRKACSYSTKRSSANHGYACALNTTPASLNHYRNSVKP